MSNDMWPKPSGRVARQGDAIMTLTVWVMAAAVVIAGIGAIVAARLLG